MAAGLHGGAVTAMIAFPLLLLLCPAARAEPFRAKPGPGIQIDMAVDPRVELLSVLLLLRGGAGASARPKPPYQRDAERWFAAYSTHPAVARAPASLDPSAPPDAAVQDFARVSGFAAFYEAHRADYRAFVEQAESEALMSIHPDAVRAYVGAGLRGRYSFVLAPLLPETFAAEGALRALRHPKDGGHPFFFDQFGDSPAHELVHAVADAWAPDEKSRQAPPGCYDAHGTARSGCVREHLVYAVTLRIIAQDLGEPVYLDMLQAYAKERFLYLEALGERLKEYEASRDRYKDLKDFYPRLEAVFSEVLPEEPAPMPSASDAEVRRLKDLGVKDFVEGRFAEAASKFKSALELAPRDPETFLDLGVVYEKLDRKAEALESYERAVAFSDPRSVRARKVREAALSSRAALLKGPSP